MVSKLSMTDLINLKFSLQHTYVNSHFKRLISSNKYIGPAAERSWKHYIDNKTEGSQQPEEQDAFEEDHIEDIPVIPQPPKNQDTRKLRRTRSGAAYL